MDPVEIICAYYPPGTALHRIFMDHARRVTEKSLEMAARVPHLQPDTGFIQEAAMLHDIGIFMTHAPAIHCRGSHPYICHGFLGRQLLDGLGFPRHGRVAERHTGAGITLHNITAHQLPLPHREMVPVTLEEKIICVADKFYSKSPAKQHRKTRRRHHCPGAVRSLPGPWPAVSRLGRGVQPFLTSKT